MIVNAENSCLRARHRCSQSDLARKVWFSAVYFQAGRCDGWNREVVGKLILYAVPLIFKLRMCTEGTVTTQDSHFSQRGEKWALQFQSAPPSTKASSQPRTRFQPSPWLVADSMLPANPSCLTRTRVPVPDFFGPEGCKLFTVCGERSQ